MLYPDIRINGILMHREYGERKNHKYIARYRKNGRWYYLYKQTYEVGKRRGFSQSNSTVSSDYFRDAQYEEEHAISGKRGYKSKEEADKYGPKNKLDKVKKKVATIIKRNTTLINF